MKIIGVSMVKDEDDVIDFTIRNLIENQGIDHLIIADNLSTDGTTEILKSHKDFVTYLLDDEVGYFQSEKMTRLAKLAFTEFGADIVVPFDADEFWTGKNIPLANILKECPDDIIHIHLYNYFTSKLDKNIFNPFERIVNRDINNAPLNKVAIRKMNEFTIHQGNHSASGSGSVGIAYNCMIGHFPWRSFSQFRNKVENGYRAYTASGLPEDMGTHWRSYGRILHEQGEDALREVYETWFCDPSEIDTVEDPVLSYI
jgi:hypothetical protein